MKRLEIIFYEKADGSQPAKDFIIRIDKKMRAKMLRTIELLQDYGTMLREPFSKPLEDEIFELWAQQGGDITRVLYFFLRGNKAVLTNGFTKKTMKTPVAEKELAKKYREDYLTREGKA